MGEEQLMEMLMSGLGDMSGDPESAEGQGEMMDAMMQTFFSKDILYEPIKDLTTKVWVPHSTAIDDLQYGEWFAAQTFDAAQEREKHEKHIKTLSKISALYEAEDDPRDQVSKLLEEVRMCLMPIDR